MSFAPEIVTGAMLGVAGSLHCALMCGSLLSFNASLTPSYVLGRLLMGAFLGIAAGVVGVGIAELSTSHIAFLIIASAMMLSLAYRKFHKSTPAEKLVTLRSKHSMHAQQRTPSGHSPTRHISRIGSAPSHPEGFALGVMTPMLPCPTLYAALIVAATSGSVVQSALVFSSFTLMSTLSVVGSAFAFRWVAQKFTAKTTIKTTRLGHMLGLGTGLSLLLWRFVTMPEKEGLWCLIKN